VSSDEIVIRNCEGLDELRACVALQKEVWKLLRRRTRPPAHVRGRAKVGGQVMGRIRRRG